MAEPGQRLGGKALLLTDALAPPSKKKGVGGVCVCVCARACTHPRVRGVTHCPSVLPQDGNVRLYSILGTTLKDEGKLLEAKGPVTDLAYSHDGAFLAVCDASKVVTVFSIADGYSVSGQAPPVSTLGSADGWRRPWPLTPVVTDQAGAQDTRLCCS